MANADEIVRGVPAALGRRAVGDWVVPGPALEAAVALFLLALLPVSAQVAGDASGGRHCAAEVFVGLAQTKERSSATEATWEVAPQSVSAPEEEKTVQA